MLKISKIFFWGLVSIIALWQIPSCYNFFAAKPADAPFTLYSSVVGDFVILRPGESKNMRYIDSILPAFYYRQLAADGRFPDTICGVAVTPRMVQMYNFNIRLSPADLNAPQVGLWPMLESMSGRVDLELPDDVFRITNKGIEFIKMETNMKDKEKSNRYTEMMIRKGFTFPAHRVSGNPTPLKEYDEGFVMLDAEHKLFHVKQTLGRPYVRNIGLPEEVVPEHIFITEFPSHRWLCFFSDTKGGFWVVERDSYRVKHTGIPAFNPQKESALIFGNLIDWTVKIDRGEKKCYYALSANDYTLIDSLTYQTPHNRLRGLRFTSSKDKFIKPRF